MERISSRQNPLVRRFRQLSSGAAENSPDVLLDGEHLVREAVASRVAIQVAAVRTGVESPTLAALADEIRASGGRLVEVTVPVLSAMSPVRQPSGIVAIASLSRRSLGQALDREPQLLFLLHAVQDPGNVGGIVRAAEACGATGIVAGEGCADPYGWKAVRGSMGSIFRLPVAHRAHLDEAVRQAQARGVAVLAAVPRDGEALPAIDLRAPTAILLGGEGPGVPDALIRQADGLLSIPMQPPVESLNVSVAAALIAYEASRQRSAVSYESVR
jgi:TrmH family RNA methyltransferase